MKTPKFIQGLKGLLSGILNSSASADVKTETPQSEAKTTSTTPPYYHGNGTDRSYEDYYPGRFRGEGGISSYYGRRF